MGEGARSCTAQLSLEARIPPGDSDPRIGGGGPILKGDNGEPREGASGGPCLWMAGPRARSGHQSTDRRPRSPPDGGTEGPRFAARVINVSTVSYCHRPCNHKRSPRSATTTFIIIRALACLHSEATRRVSVRQTAANAGRLTAMATTRQLSSRPGRVPSRK